MLKILRMTEPTHLVVLFDGEHENERVELDAQYKANRIDYSLVSEDENPFSQLKDVYSALDFMNIRHTEVSEFEADDMIASYAITYSEKMQIVISSFDSDFFQLIGDNVSVLRYRGNKTVLCDRSYIQNKYGITPEQYVDFKSLTGDNSDNIRGANKIGPKTAAQLLCEFDTLDYIINYVEKIKRPSIRESIINSTQRLKNNQKLIKLDARAKIPILLNDLTYQYEGIMTNDVLFGIGLK